MRHEILKARYLDGQAELAERAIAKLVAQYGCAGVRRMSGIEWRRGFFRLWLVLSAIWIAGVGYSFRDDLWLLTQRDLIIESSSEVAPAPTESIKEPPSGDEATTAELSRKADVIRLELRAAAFGALGVVVLPPLLTLLAGLLLGWIGHGFSQKPEHR